MAPKAGGVHAAHLPGADAHGLAVAGVDNRVALHVLADAPGKDEAAQFLGGGRTPGDHLQLRLGDAGGVGVLEQQAAGNLLDDRPRAARTAISTSRRFFLAANRSRASGVNDRRSNGFHEELGDLFSGFAVHRLVDADRRRRRPKPDRRRGLSGRPQAPVAPVAAPQGLVCLMMATAGGSASVGFSSWASSQQASRSTRLLKLNSLPCNCLAPAMPRPDAVGVESGALVGVFAVTKRLRQREVDAQRRRELVCFPCGWPRLAGARRRSRPSVLAMAESYAAVVE